MTLGECDAFMSHSWSDDGKLKYAILREWGDEFEKREGRSPTIWLDKVCTWTHTWTHIPLGRAPASRGIYVASLRRVHVLPAGVHRPERHRRQPARAARLRQRLQGAMSYLLSPNIGDA